MDFSFKRLLIFLGIYFIVDAICALVLMNYEAFASYSPGEYTSQMNVFQFFIYIIYRYILSFPLWVIAYFCEDYVPYTFYVAFLNASFLSNYRFFLEKLRRLAFLPKKYKN